MFCGIIQGRAQILETKGGNFTVKNIFSESLSIGQSIAHDGACMTITHLGERRYSFFVMEESLSKTNFQQKKLGDYFNVELCMRADTRIDGHFVSGHIDATGEINYIERKEDNSLIIGVSFKQEFSKYTIEKGSIALNGVSLTIVEKKDGYISVSLIPLTQEWTNLGNVEIGDILNIEFDMIGKYILNTK